MMLSESPMHGGFRITPQRADRGGGGVSNEQRTQATNNLTVKGTRT
uniref:Uncharacterized protein n=1 Tax=Anguilla anguilla TaxID=7936 RepID=A0A0E9Q542_ANGAN